MDLLTRPPGSTAAPPARRDSIAVCVFGLWMITGLYIDGWAHEHQKPETFFTPWHGILYSGFVAAVAWFAWDGRRRKGEGVETAPTGDRWTTIGLIGFIVGAVGDGIWHEVFGIEVDIEALLSPTHLLLMTGGVLMVTMPLRVAWAEAGDRSPSTRAFLPTLASTGLALAVVTFFLQWVSPFDIGAYGSWVERYVSSTRPGVDRDLRELFQVQGLVAVLITNAVMLASILLLVKRWRPPTGTVTLLFTSVSLAVTGLRSFEQAPLVLAAVAGGLVGDALLDRPRHLAAVVPAAMWLSFFGIHKVVFGLGWAVDLWLGVTVLACASGAVLGALSAPVSGEPEPSGAAPA